MRSFADGDDCVCDMYFPADRRRVSVFETSADVFQLVRDGMNDTRSS